jgi:hypothetical protein
MMSRLVAWSSALVLVGVICSAQVTGPPTNPPRTLEIKLPKGVPSESVFIRYVLAGEDFGGWVQPRPDVSSYVIETIRRGIPASRIRALVYARGCAIQTFDLSLPASDHPEYSFVCEPASNLSITGTITRSDRLYGRAVQLQAKYAARWAQSFFEIDPAILTEIPIGAVTDPSADGRFRLSIPDLSNDPVAAAPDHPGDLRIWARDKVTGDVVAQLVPTGPPALKTRMGGLKIQNEYPAEMVFAPCAVNPPRVHNAIGFAQRPARYDSCDW